MTAPREPNARERTALAHARHLAECGVPLFIAKPDLDEYGTWNPTGGHNSCGYWLPPNWQKAKADPAVVDKWKPGEGLAAVGGHGVDFVDVDPRNGGDESSIPMPTVYGKVKTPSGGTHHLIAGIGSRKGSPVPGIDVQAGAPDGEGRGFVWLAPTVRASKVDGVVRPYTWVHPPDVLAVTLVGGDDTGKHLAVMMRKAVEYPSDYDGPPYVGPSYADLSDELKTHAAQHQEWLWDGWRKRLAEASTWSEKHRDGRGRGWERMSADLAWAIARYAVSPWTPLDTTDAEQLYDELLPRTIAESCPGKWTARLLAKAATKPVPPPPWETADFEAVHDPHEPATTNRAYQLTKASTFKVRPVRWLWAERLAMGSLCLLGGREGIGKSTVAYTLAANITRGELKGNYEGEPRAVIVAATEDSWEYTIVPRLIAANADLDRIYRIDIATSTGHLAEITLPADLKHLGHAIKSTGAVLVLLDPLMSRLGTALDTHKDQEVRQALEPLVRMADEAGAAVLGLIHVNKSTTTDPLTSLMASRAFVAVARTVIFVMVDPDDEDGRLLGTPKNNLGRTNLPTITFSIESAHVADTDEGAVWTGRIRWTGETERSVSEALVAAGESSDRRSVTLDAADWLVDYLIDCGGSVEGGDVVKAAKVAGHSRAAVQRARAELRLPLVPVDGDKRKKMWTLRRSVTGEFDVV